MFTCDICAAPGRGTLVEASRMSTAVRAGFNPFALGLTEDIPEVREMGGAFAFWRSAVISGPLSQSDWNVCGKCMAALREYLNAPAESADKRTRADPPTARVSPGKGCALVWFLLLVPIVFLLRWIT